MSSLKATIKRLQRESNMYRMSRMTIAKRKNIGPYEIVDLLKEGSSSKIYIARSKYTNEFVAIKSLNKSSCIKNDLEGLLLIRKQIETLKILKHRNIVSLFEIYESPKYFYLITEYISGKDLIERLIRKKRFTEEQAQRIFFQLLDALIYMHKMNICHRNLRTEHILFDSNNRPKIVGFGYSSFYESNKNIEGGYGSLCYTCPEIIDDKPYNPELADVWSLGVILYVLICGYLPFSDEDDIKNKNLISSGNIDFPKEISNKLKDLLKHMLEKDPKKRYNFQKILKHPWIKPYGEKVLSQGINVYKTIFPVDERILNIVKQYGIDQNAVKNDLIMNKFNVGTGVYKQIVRILLDLKIQNISDLWSDEFAAYRDDPKNKYEDGDQRYELFIKKVDEKYQKIEDFITDFKEREDKVVERLLYLQRLKEKEENKKAIEEKKINLNVIEETFENGNEEYDKENNKSDNENEKEDEQRKKQNPTRLRAVKTLRNKKLRAIPKPKKKMHMFKFGTLMKAKQKFSHLNNNNYYSNNIHIVDNDEEEEDVDFIKQFREGQSNRASQKIIPEKQKPIFEKNPSMPNLGEDNNKDKQTLKVWESGLIKLSITPEKNREYIQNLFEKTQKNDIYNFIYNDIDNENMEENYYSNNYTSENSLYSKQVSQNSICSNMTNCTNNNISGNNNYQNNYKSILSSKNNNNSNTPNTFRMTALRKTNNNVNNKKYLIRSSIYDDFLKKKGPDFLKKVTNKPKKRSLFSNVNNIDVKNIVNLNKINEGNKENEESESESEKNDKKEKKENNDGDNNNIYENKESDNIEIIDDNNEDEKGNNDNKKDNGKSMNMRLSISFDDDDEDEDDDENNKFNDEEDIKLFSMIDSENDDAELIELKKLYYHVDDKENKNENEKENNKEDGKEKEKEKEKQSDKEKEVVKENKNENDKKNEKKPKSILKKDISKFDIVKSVLKKQIRFSNMRKTALKRVSTRMSCVGNNYDSNNSYLDLDKYEEKLKEINKNYQINDKEEKENLEKKYSSYIDYIDEDVNE